MIDSLWSYVSVEVAPRFHRILFTSHPWIAAIGAMGICAGYLPVAADTKFYDISGLFLTYDTVVIGFCVTAMAICFSFSKRFSAILCKAMIAGFSAYEDLIFVFSWTSFIHMISSVLIIFTYFSLGNFSFFDLINKGFDLFLFFILFFQFYSILQFFVTIVTVHQVAKLYAKLVSSEN